MTRRTLVRTLFFALALLTLCGCASRQVQKSSRYFWPPTPGDEKIEYLNFYFSDDDLLRGVDRRLEEVVLGKRNPKRLISQPYSVASDGKGRIFVGDFTSNQIIVLDRSTHSFRHLTEMQSPPQKVLVDKQGEIWALSATNTNIYRFGADEKFISEVLLKGMSRAAALIVDSDRQRLYLSDTPGHRICIYDYQGTLLQTLGTRGRDPGQFNYPTDLDLDAAGNLYVIDSMNARIQVFSPEGTFLRSFGERGTQSGSFSTPKGLAVSPGGLVYVTDAIQSKVVIFSAGGEYLLTLGGRNVYDGKNVRPGGLYFPAGIDVDANDTIFIADFFNGMIHEFQYLTPAYLAKRPIRAEEAYQPQAVDLRASGQEETPTKKVGQEENPENRLENKLQ